MAIPTQHKIVRIVTPLIVGMALVTMPKKCHVNCEMLSSSPVRVSSANVNAHSPSPPHEALGMWEPVTMPRGSVYRTASFSSPDEGWAFGGYDPAYWNGQAWVERQSLPELRLVTSVKFLSADNGWAVGDRSVILHWDGERWTRVTAPTMEDDILEGVGFASPDLGWAVGVADFGQPGADHDLMLEWNGTEWIRLEDLPASWISAIDVLSATEGWAVGPPTELLHWNGQQWGLHEINAPKILEFYSVAVVSPNDAWMVGETETNEGAIWHWDGHQWAEFQRTRLPLFSVSMVSSDFGWAVGGNGLWQKVENGSLLMHWNGQTWTEYPISTTVPLRYVWAPSTTDGWIFGGGPTDVIHGEYPGVAFRYRILTVTPTASATPSILPSDTPVATQTVAAAGDLSATPRVVATSTPLPPELNSETLQNALPWIAVVGMLILLGSIALVVYRRRRS
jgi:photosystem II stability/assembly factor-like uncharacterized protein